MEQLRHRLTNVSPQGQHRSVDQNIARFAIAVIALRAGSNRLDDTRPLMKELLALLPNSKPGTLTFIPES